MSVSYRDDEGSERCCTPREAATVGLQDCQPVRRFPAHRRQHHMPGLYWFATTARHIPYESRLEMSVLIELDFALDVTGVSAQPFRLGYRRNGKIAHHVPDFFVLRSSDCRQVIDVKPADRVDRPTNQAVFDVTRSACREAGWDYAVATGPEPAIWANLSWLAGYRRLPADPFGYEHLLLDRCEHPTPVVELIASVGPPALVRPALFSLLWRQELTVDLGRPLASDTLVAPRGHRRDAA